MNIRENVPIGELTTMRLGGMARYVIEINSADEIAEAYQFAADKNLPVFIMGDGSNVIGRDEGFAGVVLVNGIKGMELDPRNKSEDDDGCSIVTCGSGEKLDDLVDFAIKNGLTGIEALSAIPGTVGGAVYQNSGAYGQDMSQVLTTITAYDSKKQQLVTLSNKKLDFSYRSSLFKKVEKNRYFITSVTLRLKTGEIQGELYKSLQIYLDENEIFDRRPATIRRAVTTIRANKLPDPVDKPSAGSFFHNVVLSQKQAKKLQTEYPDAPIFDMNGQKVVASGWLIEQCGLKGQTLHGIKIHDQAALILINESAKSYADLAAARAEIRTAVEAKFGLKLVQEPIEI